MNLICLLGLPLLACIMLSAILGYIGIHVIKREVIFIDIAVAQIAALGAIGAHLLLHLHEDSVPTLLCGIAATMLAALFFSIMQRRVNHLPIEALIGITYVVAAAASLFIIGKSPDGHAHIQKMLTGALLWVTPHDVAWAALILGGVGLVFFCLRHPLQQLSDQGKATHSIRWDFLFYTLCGTVITIGVKLAGVLVVFSLLIVPATLSALFSSHWNTRTGIALLAGTTAALGGLLLSYSLDVSAGAAITFLLIFLLACSATLHTAVHAFQRKRG